MDTLRINLLFFVASSLRSNLCFFVDTLLTNLLLFTGFTDTFRLNLCFFADIRFRLFYDIRKSVLRFFIAYALFLAILILLISRLNSLADLTFFIGLNLRLGSFLYLPNLLLDTSLGRIRILEGELDVLFERHTLFSLNLLDAEIRVGIRRFLVTGRDTILLAFRIRGFRDEIGRLFIFGARRTIRVLIELLGFLNERGFLDILVTLG